MDRKESQRKSNRKYQEKKRREHGIKTKEQVLSERKVEFIIKSQQTHNNMYDYNLVHYTNSKEKVQIICPIHNSFFQTLDAHSRGQGCPQCGAESRRDNRKRRTTKEFILEASCKHSNKYDYSDATYVNVTTKLNIICPEHGEFMQ